MGRERLEQYDLTGPGADAAVAAGLAGATGSAAPCRASG